MITAATASDVCFVHVLDDTERSLTLAGATPPVRRRGRRDPAAAGSGHLGLGGQPPRARGDQSRQGGRPAVSAVRIVARQGLHVDGVGADGDRSGWSGRGAQRAHRRTSRVHRGRRGTAARHRPADRAVRCIRPGCTGSWWPANARTRTSSSRSSRRRRSSGAGSPATSTTASRSGSSRCRIGSTPRRGRSRTIRRWSPNN